MLDKDVFLPDTVPKRRLNSLFCMCNTHQCDGERVEILCFCLGKRGRRNGAEPYQTAILTGGWYRGGGIACACCGYIWADKETDTDKTAFMDAEETV